jgi:peptidoglycan L-alanyl-D-glutamate endopeptidase CwlK
MSSFDRKGIKDIRVLVKGDFLKGKSKRRYYVIAAAVLICLIVGSFFLVRHIAYSPKPVPVPTGLDPNFLNQVNKCFIPTAAAYGYDLRIVSGFRSLAEQQQIYAQGRLENGTVVSEAPPGHSLHNYGFAVDVVDRYKGYNIDWPKLIAIGAYCGLGNGGGGDEPHFEYRGGLVTDQFAAGMRPVPLVLPCTLMAIKYYENQPLTLSDLKSCGAPSFSGY